MSTRTQDEDTRRYDAKRIVNVMRIRFENVEIYKRAPYLKYIIINLLIRTV